MLEFISANSFVIGGFITGFVSGVAAFFNLKSDVRVLKLQVSYLKTDLAGQDNKIKQVWEKYDTVNDKLTIILEKLAHIEGYLDKPK